MENQTSFNNHDIHINNLINSYNNRSNSTLDFSFMNTINKYNCKIKISLAELRIYNDLLELSPLKRTFNYFTISTSDIITTRTEYKVKLTLKKKSKFHHKCYKQTSPFYKNSMISNGNSGNDDANTNNTRNANNKLFFDMKFPLDYPYNGPSITLINNTEIDFPFIEYNGALNLDTLKHWKTYQTLTNIVSEIESRIFFGERECETGYSNDIVGSRFNFLKQGNSFDDRILKTNLVDDIIEKANFNSIDKNSVNLFSLNTNTTINTQIYANNTHASDASNSIFSCSYSDDKIVANNVNNINSNDNLMEIDSCEVDDCFDGNENEDKNNLIKSLINNSLNHNHKKRRWNELSLPV